VEAEIAAVPDDILEAITVAGSAADLGALLTLAQTYFAGTQREQLEAAAAKRQGELPTATRWVPKPSGPPARDLSSVRPVRPV
jgi:hypothetical protein